MNRRELVQAVAAYAGVEPREVDSVLKSTTEVITAVVSKGEPVTLSGFAKFVKQERPARMGRNPATGEQIKIKASKKAKITPLKGFKDAVMNPKEAPKLPKGVWPTTGGGPAGGTAKKAPATASGSAGGAKKAPAKKAPATASGSAGGAKKAPAKKAPAKKAAAKKG